MEKIISESDLRNAILRLEEEQDEARGLVRAQFEATYYGLNPVNMIRGYLSELTGTSELKSSIINIALAAASAFVTKQLSVPEPHSTARKLFSASFLYGIAKVVAKNPDKLMYMGEVIATFIKNLWAEKDAQDGDDGEGDTRTYGQPFPADNVRRTMGDAL